LLDSIKTADIIVGKVKSLEIAETFRHFVDDLDEFLNTTDLGLFEIVGIFNHGLRKLEW
jgi:hypothetical protein